LGWSLVRRLLDDTDPIFGKLTVDVTSASSSLLAWAISKRSNGSPWWSGSEQVLKVWFRCIGKTWKGVGGHLFRDRILGIGISTPDAQPAAPGFIAISQPLAALKYTALSYR
jgi:hypothetical protein